MALLQISEPGQSQDPHQKKFYVGIDLGTTNSLIALIQNGSPKILKDQGGNELFPSVVNYTKDAVSVGNFKNNDKSITFNSIKRLIGKGINDIDINNFYSPCKYSGDEMQELWYDKRSYFGKQNSTLESIVPLAMFVFIRDVIAEKMFQSCHAWWTKLGCRDRWVDVW